MKFVRPISNDNTSNEIFLFKIYGIQLNYSHIGPLYYGRAREILLSVDIPQRSVSLPMKKCRSKKKNIHSIIKS